MKGLMGTFELSKIVRINLWSRTGNVLLTFRGFLIDEVSVDVVLDFWKGGFEGIGDSRVR